MKKLLILFSLFFLIEAHSQKGKDSLNSKFVLVIHGGAGTLLKSQISPEKEKAYRDALDLALDAGYAILKKGGSALDAVEAAVRFMEDNPLFNAGKGAVFTNEGKNELDAAIMDGRTLAAGSVAGVTTIRNPISAARAVMEKSPHVMMTGKGAEKFAQQQGLQIVDPSYFYTEDRWRGLQNARQKDSLDATIRRQTEAINTGLNAIYKQIDGARKSADSLVRPGDTMNTDSTYHPTKELLKDIKGSTGLRQKSNNDDKYGTVGAVALDRHGNLAAATSTGGMTNKKFGRVGDAPIIGAGTYANNSTVAISGTGWGEYFIRLVMAKTISDMMEFGKMSLKSASTEMIMKRLPGLGGDGGLIAVDKNGNIALPFCTEGMYRGFIKENNGSAERSVKIYKD
ncbi:MAG: isoaspartyl peptidase/L-asparaginase [Chitinophagaceae bacterium]|nr:isoaspartyl peptidase/L-asparaginase [Chitinophagaceae bacterium]